MKMILHLMRREVAQQRTYIIMLLAWLVVGFVWELIATHFLSDDDPLNFAMLFKTIIVPLFYLGVCAPMGAFDSPRRENHHLLTRPIRLYDLYFSKALLVLIGAALFALGQSVINLIEGFPTSFFTVFITIGFGGLAILFLTAIPENSVRSFTIIALIGGIFVSAAAASMLLFLKFTAVTVYEPPLWIVVLYAAAVTFCIFTISNTRFEKIIRGISITAVLLLLAVLLPLTPFSYSRLSSDQVPPAVVNPDFKVEMAQRNYLAISPMHGQDVEQIKHPFTYRPRSIELTTASGILHRLSVGGPISQTNRGLRGIENRNTHLYSQVALGLRKLPIDHDHRSWLESKPPWRTWRFSAELLGQEVTAIVRGKVHFHELISLGKLPLIEDAKLSADLAKIRILETPTENRPLINLRFQNLSSTCERVGVLFSSTTSDLIESEAFDLEDEFISEGLVIGTDEFYRIRNPSIVASIQKGDPWFLNFYTWTNKGTSDFESKPIKLRLTPSEITSTEKPLLATYPVNPTIPSGH